MLNWVYFCSISTLKVWLFIARGFWIQSYATNDQISISKNIIINLITNPFSSSISLFILDTNEMFHIFQTRYFFLLLNTIHWYFHPKNIYNSIIFYFAIIYIYINNLITGRLTCFCDYWIRRLLNKAFE